MATGSRRTRKPLALTAKIIEALKPDPNGAYYQPDLRCKGLSIRVASDGGKTGNLAFRIKGAGGKQVSLGRYQDVGLEAMRDRADDITKAGRGGHDLLCRRTSRPRRA